MTYQLTPKQQWIIDTAAYEAGQKSEEFLTQFMLSAIEQLWVTMRTRKQTEAVEIVRQALAEGKTLIITNDEYGFPIIEEQ